MEKFELFVLFYTVSSLCLICVGYFIVGCKEKKILQREHIKENFCEKNENLKKNYNNIQEESKIKIAKNNGVIDIKMPKEVA